MVKSPGRPAAGAVRFFRTPADFRRWLEKNHDAAAELWVGFYKKETGRPAEYHV